MIEFYILHTPYYMMMINFGVTDKNLIELDTSSSPISPTILSAADLGHTLRGPKALKALFCRAYPPTAMNFTVIRHVLGPWENCLESLGFVCGPDATCYRPPREPIFGPDIVYWLQHHQGLSDLGALACPDR